MKPDLGCELLRNGKEGWLISETRYQPLTCAKPAEGGWIRGIDGGGGCVNK